MAMFFSYFELASSLFILLLAFHIWTRHHENKTARFFAFFALIAFFAAILEYSSRIAFTLEAARDIDRVCVVFWALSFSMFAHFSFVFTKKIAFLKNRLAPIFFYLPSAIVGGLFLFTNTMYTRFEIWPIGIVSQPSVWYSIFMAQTIFYCSISLAVLYHYGFTARQKTEQIRSLFIATGCTFPLVVGIITDQVIPIAFGARLTPPTAVFCMALMNFFIYMAMRNYSLFSISPSLAADIVIETMPDSLIITDLDGRVVLLNEDAKKFFHANKEQILGRPIFALFKDKGLYSKLYSEVVDKNLEIKRFEADLLDPLGETIPALINANKLHDALGAILGIVYVIRDIRG